MAGKDLSQAGHTADIQWDFGSDGEPTAQAMQTVLESFIGQTKIKKHDAVHDVILGTYTYRWDITFTQMQEADAGDVDMLTVTKSQMIHSLEITFKLRSRKL